MPTSRRLHLAALVAVRESLGITPATVARDIGVSRGYYSRLESGSRQGTITTAKKIADRLGVTLDAITYPVSKGDAA